MDLFFCCVNPFSILDGIEYWSVELEGTDDEHSAFLLQCLLIVLLSHGSTVSSSLALICAVLNSVKL
jgi:hypothetical protein